MKLREIVTGRFFQDDGTNIYSAIRQDGKIWAINTGMELLPVRWVYENQEKKSFVIRVLVPYEKGLKEVERTGFNWLTEVSLYEWKSPAAIQLL